VIWIHGQLCLETSMRYLSRLLSGTTGAACLLLCLGIGLVGLYDLIEFQVAKWGRPRYVIVACHLKGKCRVCRRLLHEIEGPSLKIDELPPLPNDSASAAR
jgi:hypothetical protein